MFNYSFLLLIPFTLLAFISLPNNLLTDLKENKLNKSVIKKFINSVTSIVFILTFLQILSFKFFFFSNILKPLVYIFYTRSLLRSTLIILSYFFTSSILNIFINQNPEINLLLIKQSNINIYMFLFVIYIFLNLLSFSNSFTSRLLSVYQKYPQSLTLKVLLSILLSARFNVLNKNYLILTIFISAISSVLITFAAYNLSNNFFLIDITFILCLSLISYIFNNFYFKDINKNKNNSLVKSLKISIKVFLENTSKRVFIADYCFKKDPSLSMLTEIIKLQQKKFKILSGGFSKNIVLLDRDKNFIYKIFDSKDVIAEKYFNYHLYKEFKEKFLEYDKKVFYRKQKRLTYIQLPFFSGKTAFEQFFYYTNINSSNKNKIDLMLHSIIEKMNDLHSIKIISNKKFFKNHLLTREDHKNYIELKFFKNAYQLIQKKLFKDNNKKIDDLRMSINNLSKEWNNSNKNIVYTHGDLSFSNIIISFDDNEKINVNFIDPNPSNLDLFPSPIIDISKLLQSTYVMWELASKNNDYLDYGMNNTKGIFMLPQPNCFKYAENEIREFANSIGFSCKIQDLHLLIHLSRILPYISKNTNLENYIIGYIYFILFEKY